MYLENLEALLCEVENLRDNVDEFRSHGARVPEDLYEDLENAIQEAAFEVREILDYLGV